VDNSLHTMKNIADSGYKEQGVIRKFFSKALMQTHSVTAANLLCPTGSSVLQSPNFLRPAYP